MMTASAKRRIQMFCAWGGFWYMGILLLGWGLIGGYLPPHSPAASASEIAAIYQGDVTRIRIGLVVMMVGAFMCIPFTAILAQYISRIEGKPGILTYFTLMGGLGNTFLSFYPAIFWLVAAFRTDRSPELIQLFNDLAWLQCIGGTTIFWPVTLGMAIAALCDGSKDPVFPRWSGWASIWLFFLILPDQLLFFFQTGPFAWNGLFGLWLPLAAFGSWFALASILMVRAMRRGITPDSD